MSVFINAFGISTITTSIYSWVLMTAVNINDSNKTVLLDTSYLFTQSHWMLPFAQYCPLILPSRFSVRKMRNSMDRLRSWLVILFTSIGLKHVLSCSCLISNNASYNIFSPNWFITFVRLYVWENIWPNTVAYSIVYSIVRLFSSTVCIIKWMVLYVFPIIVGSNMWTGAVCRVDLLDGCGIFSWYICSGGFSFSVPTPVFKLLCSLTIVVLLL